MSNSVFWCISSCNNVMLVPPRWLSQGRKNDEMTFWIFPNMLADSPPSVSQSCLTWAANAGVQGSFKKNQHPSRRSLQAFKNKRAGQHTTFYMLCVSKSTQLFQVCLTDVSFFFFPCVILILEHHSELSTPQGFLIRSIVMIENHNQESTRKRRRLTN